MALKPPHAKVIQSVHRCLERDKAIQRFWIAYSGGIDSHVLLHVISSQRHHFPNIHFHAVHINHALNRQADQWAEHCRKMCEQLQIPFLARRGRNRRGGAKSRSQSPRSALSGNDQIDETG